jgi:hypothetical protein
MPMAKLSGYSDRPVSSRVLAEAELEVGRPPGVAPGSNLDASLALNFPQLPLPPGRFQWQADIAGAVQVESFMVLKQ